MIYPVIERGGGRGGCPHTLKKPPYHIWEEIFSFGGPTPISDVYVLVQENSVKIVRLTKDFFQRSASIRTLYERLHDVDGKCEETLKLSFRDLV